MCLTPCRFAAVGLTIWRVFANGLVEIMKKPNFFARKEESFKHIFILEGWRSYTRLNGGSWIKVKLPRGNWQHTFCADPFLFRHDDINWLFYETKTLDGKGIIGCSKELHGKWSWQGIVLEENWHLSYPQVFGVGDKVYMIPESCKLGAVCLYEAVTFPYKWKMVKQLINEPLADATLLVKDSHYYLACYRVGPRLDAELWHADSLTGEWKRHPMSFKMKRARRLRRCGGRFKEDEGQIFRIAQDCNGFYGKRLFKVPVLKLSAGEYEEGDATLLLDKNISPFGMKHTYNSMQTPEGFMEVVDVHHDVLRRFGEISRRLGKTFYNKVFGK